MNVFISGIVNTIKYALRPIEAILFSVCFTDRRTYQKNNNIDKICRFKLEIIYEIN